MKKETAWNHCTFIAENENDQKILHQLILSLPNIDNDKAPGEWDDADILIKCKDVDDYMDKDQYMISKKLVTEVCFITYW